MVCNTVVGRRLIELNIDEYLIKTVLCSPLPSEMGKMLDTE